MKLAVIHSLCTEDNCTETWIGYVPDHDTEKTVGKRWMERGRKPLHVFFTDGFEVSCL